MAEHERVRSAAVDQPERDPGVRGMDDRALTLDEQELSPALVALDDEPLRRPGDEVRDDGVDRDPPAGDRDPGLPRRNELATASPRARAARSSSSDTVIFPIAQSEPTVRTICAGTLEVLARRAVEPVGRPAEIAKRDAVACGELAQLRVVGRGTRAGRSRSPEPSRMQARSSSRHSGGNRPPCVATPTSATVGLNGSASCTAPTTGSPSWVSPARVESRIATTSSRR